jgi:hypothetical protein
MRGSKTWIADSSMPPKKVKVVSLTQALSQLLDKTLMPDLEARAEEPDIGQALQQQYEIEKNAERTAESFREFVARTLEQVGAAWILSCVFVRVLEDRGLLSRNRIAGPGAADSDQLFFELAPSLTMRDYLLTVFQEVASLPGAAEVLGPRHNPAFRFSPSNEGARALLDFFREEGSEGLRWQFTGDDTRFLGDLYQDLSEDVRKRYALLQTPSFVEAFILEQTLRPAIEEYGLEDVRVIDPTCGSGHFLLGAFERVLDERLRRAPGVDVRTHALSALAQVYGVDVNPYAVAIARFRLTLAYLSRCGFTRLAQAPKLQLNLVVADSLLHGADKATLTFAQHESGHGDERAWGLSVFALDDPEEAQRIFSQRYHAVVGNPPYITCKDAKLREQYRAAYTSAAGKYALAAPFTERFFQLAVDGGYVGMINANSFMKREFGRALIEQVLRHKDLTRVIDTAGAYIPGHGTPTVLLFGRNRQPASEHVNAVLGKRGEPSTPDDAEQGLVWRSIADQLDEIGFENEYVTVAQVPRATLDKHPWSLGGGGAAELKELLEERSDKTLGEVVTSIGFMAITGEDDVFARPADAWRRVGAEDAWLKELGAGEGIRDWSICCDLTAAFPYRDAALVEPSAYPQIAKALWPFRRLLLNRPDFGGKKYIDVGRPWYSYHQVPLERLRTPLSITFAEVATHNHFVLDRGGKIFKQTAPIIKLPESATEDDHLALLAYLNSSTACFWMKQVCHDKGNRGEGGGFTSEGWERFFQFNGTALSEMPIPKLDGALVSYGRELSLLGEQRSRSIASEETSVDANEQDKKLDAIELEIRIAQERLDWHVYQLFGLHTDGPNDGEVVVLSNGLRPSDIRFARAVLGSGIGGRRYFEFARLGAPDDAAARHDFDDVIRSIEKHEEIQLLETPDYKRTYREGFRRHDREVLARQQALTAAEHHVSLLQTPISERVLLGETLSDSAATSLSTVDCTAEAVPFLTAGYLTATGLTKRDSWMRTWLAQREEELGGVATSIPIPPKYDSKDFTKAHYFRLRGKLDVPKERFISYPGCQKDGDDSPLIGWAGWNHLQRAQALISLYQERKQEDGWPKERLMPMLVGLHELMFWLELWHSQPEAGSDNPAREIRQYLDAELNAHKLTTADLEAWRPTDTKKPRKTKSKAKADDA